jgi:hypothetical protein
MTMGREFRHGEGASEQVVGRYFAYGASTAAAFVTVLLRSVTVHLNTGPIGFEQLTGQHVSRSSMRSLSRHDG